ncbi:MAG: PilZ domain-containing protein, partial [Gammaproteobacteria bacterium]|nr:PilZ domain-containing protein [Gammaproteobacteria bacterium]
GRVVVHNNGQLTIGQGVNISASGIFVETSDQLFSVGEQLKLSVRCDGLKKPFNAEADVIRFSSDPRWPVGYGLRFVDIPEQIRKNIQELVEELNKAG